MRSCGRRKDLHEHEEEPPGSVINGMFSVVEALDIGGDEGSVEMELEVVAGEHGGGVQSLEHALGDSEVVVVEERCVGRRERKSE